MKIQEIMEAKKLPTSAADLDDTDEPAPDADQDKIPNIFVQLRKAVDVDGNYPITFQDGKKAKLDMSDISNFVQKYMNLKPNEKEEFQHKAAQSLEGFKAAIAQDMKKKELPKIKGSRYMSHMAGDFDDK